MTCNTTIPIIGMSPGNSYFKEREISHLLSCLLQSYAKVAVFIPDIPAISTYLSLGYPLNKAKDKALSKGNNLKNKTKKCANALLIPSDRILLIDWRTQVEPNSIYTASYTQVQTLYNTNPSFKKAVHNTTAAVLTHAGKPLQDLEEATQIASHYLLSELAFLEVAPTLLSTETAFYVYHKPWPVFTDYIEGRFDDKPRPHLGFFLLEPPIESTLPSQ